MADKTPRSNSQGKAPANKGDADAARPAAPGRLSRLRFKKKDMPGGLWLKCPSCERTIYRKELEAKGHVCPSCSFHFTMPGRERIAMVLDEGSWEEHFADLTTLDRLSFEDSIPYSEKIERTVEKTGQNEALLCGTGAIEGRPIVLAVLDFKFLGGSMGEVVGEKIALAADLAAKHRLPLVIFTSSGGARMHEGMFSLMQMAKTCAGLARVSDAGGLSICVLTNPTTGGVTASFASVCDLTLAEPGALIGFAGPRVIASTIKQELPPGFQRSEFLVTKGQVDCIVDRSEMRSTLALLIDYGTTTWDGYPPPRPAKDADSGEENGEGTGEDATGDGATGDGETPAGDGAAADDGGPESLVSEDTEVVAEDARPAESAERGEEETTRS